MQASFNRKIGYSGLALTAALVLGPVYTLNRERDNVPQSVQRVRQITAELTNLVTADDIYMREVERINRLIVEKDSITGSQEYKSARQSYEARVKRAVDIGTISMCAGALLAFASYRFIRKAQKEEN